MRKLATLLLLFTALLMQAGEHYLQNVYSRDIISLNGQWNYIVDPFSNGYYDYRLNPNPNGFFKNAKAKNKSDLVEYNFDTSDAMYVPSDWNTRDEKLFFYEGTVWFKRDFTYTRKENRKTFLHFGAVNYDTRVYLNGELLGRHTGGFTPFNFDISAYSTNDNKELILIPLLSKKIILITLISYRSKL